MASILATGSSGALGAHGFELSRNVCAALSTGVRAAMARRAGTQVANATSVLRTSRGLHTSPPRLHWCKNWCPPPPPPPPGAAPTAAETLANGAAAGYKGHYNHYHWWYANQHNTGGRRRFRLIPILATIGGLWAICEYKSLKKEFRRYRNGAEAEIEQLKVEAASVMETARAYQKALRSDGDILKRFSSRVESSVSALENKQVTWDTVVAELKQAVHDVHNDVMAHAPLPPPRVSQPTSQSNVLHHHPHRINAADSTVAHNEQFSEDRDTTANSRGFHRHWHHHRREWDNRSDRPEDYGREGRRGD
eukprot:comp24019_c0_seq1/m.42939 comp24019_c0_seq1/g.42939  ORF comp24019_c0_seq1/g.42939 comp24019_c0_seq1/m.42939 type:complete len:307 (-) comp24019_c0_seq1:1125-2045(-)